MMVSHQQTGQYYTWELLVVKEKTIRQPLVMTENSISST